MCGFCRFFLKAGGEESLLDFGQCRIRSVPHAFPKRDISDWCGEFDADPVSEAKLYHGAEAKAQQA
ncbi:MAG: hypothetical protein EBR82_29490 [Caulobacteraceae bacterium]|nr:hypothetical protein [Caulobacteraceae bacterium]